MVPSMCSADILEAEYGILEVDNYSNFVGDVTGDGHSDLLWAEKEDPNGDGGIAGALLRREDLYSSHLTTGPAPGGLRSLTRPGRNGTRLSAVRCRLRSGPERRRCGAPPVPSRCLLRPASALRSDRPRWQCRARSARRAGRPLRTRSNLRSRGHGARGFPKIHPRSGLR